jgi:hypothetical protein
LDHQRCDLVLWVPVQRYERSRTACAQDAARVIVPHGHRHRDWVGVCGDIVLSTSLGGDRADGCRGSLRAHEFTALIDGESG